MSRELKRGTIELVLLTLLKERERYGYEIVAAIEEGSKGRLEVRDGTAYISMGGGCVGCAQVDVTLRQGVEVAIKQSVPEIVAIVDTTDHASGTNPYYTPDK